MQKREINLPPKTGKPTKVINFLENCGIKYITIENLLNEGLLYQDTFGNMVFRNYNGSCGEIRTTKEDPPKSYHPITPRESAEKFWYMGKRGGLVYIATNAVDAVALYELTGEPAIYASCSGSNNYKIIQRIIDSGRDVILALDNSPTSDRAREKYPENEKLTHIKPTGKNWVEDLQNKKGL